MLTRAASLPLVFSVLACSACVGSVPADVDAQPPAQTGPAPSVETGAEPDEADGSAPARVATPEPREPLPDCPADADASVYCTAEGKLAGAWGPADGVRFPVDATVFFELEASNHDRSSLVVAGLGEVLYIRHSTCSACARIMGRGFEGRPAALSDEQRQALQRELGLPDAAPLLTDVDAWAAYCRGDGQAALTAIAGRDRSSQP